MIGASLSGVTFISVPGWVGSTGFSYMQMVLGYLLGYIFIAQVLLPLFYRLQLTSIYSYLNNRFGIQSYQTGAILFLVSKTIGAAARLYLMASVLQLTIFDALHVPFMVTVIVTIGLIWLYTFRGGIRTVIWTDMVQAILMILAVVLTVGVILNTLNLSVLQGIELIRSSSYSHMFEFSDWSSKQHFVKQFLSGAFMTIVMTGLDQDMMQKNLTCKSLSDAKKNMYWYSIAFVPVNLIFLALGALLYIFVDKQGIVFSGRGDDLFPMLATGGYFPPIVGILFMLGLVAAAYSSADSALTSLTTSFSVDLLKVEKMEPQQAVKTRRLVHIGVSIVLGLVIVLFRVLDLDTIISTIFTIAGYTYGPLLGLFAFGLFTKLRSNDSWTPYIAVGAPVLIGVMDYYFKFGFEKLIYNGIVVFLCLLLSMVSNRNKLLKTN